MQQFLIDLFQFKSLEWHFEEVAVCVVPKIQQREKERVERENKGDPEQEKNPIGKDKENI